MSSSIRSSFREIIWFYNYCKSLDFNPYKQNPPSSQAKSQQFTTFGSCQAHLVRTWSWGFVRAAWAPRACRLTIVARAAFFLTTSKHYMFCRNDRQFSIKCSLAWVTRSEIDQIRSSSSKSGIGGLISLKTCSFQTQCSCALFGLPGVDSKHEHASQSSDLICSRSSLDIICFSLSYLSSRSASSALDVSRARSSWASLPAGWNRFDSKADDIANFRMTVALIEFCDQKLIALAPISLFRLKATRFLREKAGIGGFSECGSERVCRLSLGIESSAARLCIGISRALWTWFDWYQPASDGNRNTIANFKLEWQWERIVLWFRTCRSGSCVGNRRPSEAHWRSDQMRFCFKLLVRNLMQERFVIESGSQNRRMAWTDQKWLPRPSWQMQVIDALIGEWFSRASDRRRIHQRCFRSRRGFLRLPSACSA